MDPNVPEKLRCGSPGYVAPEILNNLGYGTKADIFSAGIILCVILTGVSPFHGKNYQDVLLKNREGTVSLSQSHWGFVSPEAKDLVSKMVAKDPQNRCSACEALQHPWFSLEHTSTSMLSNAQENMRKYHNKQNENRFNVSKIKPEFSMVTCTPLLNSRFAGQDSPLIVPRGSSKDVAGQSPVLQPRTDNPEDTKTGVKAAVLIRDIHDKFRPGIKKLSSFTNKGNIHSIQIQQDDEAANFNENEIDEKPADSKATANVKALHKSFVPCNFLGRMIPPTPGFTDKKSMSYLKSIATPMQNRRVFKSGAAMDGKAQYLQRIAEVRVSEETKKIGGNKAQKKENNVTPTGSPPAKALPSTISNPSTKQSPRILNEYQKYSPKAIAEVTNSNVTDGPLEKFDTALSHKSPSGISSSDGPTDRDQRKDTPKFGPGAGQRMNPDMLAAGKKDETATTNSNSNKKSPQQEHSIRINKVKPSVKKEEHKG